MKKRSFTRLISMVLVIMIFLTGCGNKLAEGYDKDEIKQTAEEIITDVSVRGAKTVLSERLREDYLAEYPLDDMDENVLNLMSGLGNFLAYTKETVTGKEKDGEDFAIILVTASYEKGEILYTLTFDKEMNLVSFYAKS